MKALASVLERVRGTRSRTLKEQILAEYLVGLDDATLVHAARMLAGRVFPVDDRRSAGAGFVAWRGAAALVTGWDAETVVDCMRATGDAGEAIGLLIHADARSRAAPGMDIAAVVKLAETLSASGSPARKITLLAEAMRRLDGLSAKYLVKLLSNGLRVGAQQGVVEAAIARAAAVPPDDVRRALARTADVGEVALLARRDELDRAQVRIGRPVGFMLATPIQSVTHAPTGEAWHVEDKLDGIRAQAHKRGATVRLFARSGDPLDGTFPEIEAALGASPRDFILDGEIIAIDANGAIAPFATLQERLNRKRVSDRDRARIPVAYVAFDQLADGSDAGLIDRPWSERRARLESLLATEMPSDRVRLLPTQELRDRDLESLRAEALARGAEGLVLKRTDAPYDAGRRGQSWIKVKAAYATLDVVITAAEEGHGKRRGMLSDYTFAVWRDAELVTIGKAYSGLTDEEIEALTTRLGRITDARYGRVRAVRPEIVLEIAFDGISRSARHRSGFALRFPRIVRVRDDKSPAQANTLADVEALFEAQGRARARRE